MEDSPENFFIQFKKKINYQFEEDQDQDLDEKKNKMKNQTEDRLLKSQLSKLRPKPKYRKF